MLHQQVLNVPGAGTNEDNVLRFCRKAARILSLKFRNKQNARFTQYCCPRFERPRLPLLALIVAISNLPPSPSLTVCFSTATFRDVSIFPPQVTIALADKTRGHVPFRQSKLTHLLKVRLRRAMGFPYLKTKCTRAYGGRGGEAVAERPLWAYSSAFCRG